MNQTFSVFLQLTICFGPVNKRKAVVIALKFFLFGSYLVLNSGQKPKTLLEPILRIISKFLILD